jgi:hypothetical protein
MAGFAPLPNFSPAYLQGYVPRKTNYKDKAIASLISNVLGQVAGEYTDSLITTQEEQALIDMKNAQIESMLDANTRADAEAGREAIRFDNEQFDRPFKEAEEAERQWRESQLFDAQMRNTDSQIDARETEASRQEYLDEVNLTNQFIEQELAALNQADEAEYRKGMLDLRRAEVDKEPYVSDQDRARTALMEQQLEQNKQLVRDADLQRMTTATTQSFGKGNDRQSIDMAAHVDTLNEDALRPEYWLDMYDGDRVKAMAAREKWMKASRERVAAKAEGESIFGEEAPPIMSEKEFDARDRHIDKILRSLPLPTGPYPYTPYIPKK